jgi:hypothetical protein
MISSHVTFCGYCGKQQELSLPEPLIARRFHIPHQPWSPFKRNSSVLPSLPLGSKRVDVSKSGLPRDMPNNEQISNDTKWIYVISARDIILRDLPLDMPKDILTKDNIRITSLTLSACLKYDNNNFVTLVATSDSVDNTDWFVKEDLKKTLKDLLIIPLIKPIESLTRQNIIDGALSSVFNDQIAGFKQTTGLTIIDNNVHLRAPNVFNHDGIVADAMDLVTLSEITNDLARMVGPRA